MPLPSIRTGRVLLWPWRHDDTDALHTLWAAPEVRRYLWDDIVITHETAQRAVESHLASSDRLNIGYWALDELLAGLRPNQPAQLRLFQRPS
jgi:RimJ/RimL family protein N-acetyltransferase